jgi:hypothetical protein
MNAINVAELTAGRCDDHDVRRDHGRLDDRGSSSSRDAVTMIE